MSKHMLSISCKGATKFQRYKKYIKISYCQLIRFSKFDAANIVVLSRNKNCDLVAATIFAT